jgi:hypothetical protein
MALVEVRRTEDAGPRRKVGFIPSPSPKAAKLFQEIEKSLLLWTVLLDFFVSLTVTWGREAGTNNLSPGFNCI